MKNLSLVRVQGSESTDIQILSEKELKHNATDDVVIGAMTEITKRCKLRSEVVTNAEKELVGLEVTVIENIWGTADESALSWRRFETKEVKA